MSDTDPDAARPSLIEAVDGRLRREKRAKKGIVFFFTGVGSALAAAGALFAQDFAWNGAALTAIVGIVMVLAAAWYQYKTQDETDHLVDAFSALRMQEEIKADLSAASSISEFFEEAASVYGSLYLVMSNGRNVIESILEGPKPDEQEAINTLLEHVRQDLLIALGFSPKDIYTVVVYRAEFDPSDGYFWLRCISHERQIKCELSDARRWREGIGVGGMAFARDDEVAAPDILASSAKSLFSLTSGHVRELDYKRYRSLVAVPVNVGNDPKPWGVVLASSDQPNHFLVDGEHDDLMASLRSEALRAFGGMVALAVAGIRSKAHIDSVRESRLGREKVNQKPAQASKTTGQSDGSEKS